jgi:hypothetical protein
MCWRCSSGGSRPRGSCSGCARPDKLLHEGRCHWCHKRDTARCADCATPSACHVRVGLGAVVCAPCALRRDFDALIPPDSNGALHPLRPFILRARPDTARMFLSHNGKLLRQLHDGAIPLNHAELDRLPHAKSTAYLRALLIAAAVLPPDATGRIRSLEAVMHTLEPQLEDAHRQVFNQWTHWVVLPRLRRLADAGKDLTHPTGNDRAKVRQVSAFLVHLQAAHVGLTACRQRDVDQWFDGAGPGRHLVRPFLSWAQRKRHVPTGLRLPHTYQGAAEVPVDAEQRWAIARRLLSDEALDPVDRVSGLLIALYAQPLTKIVTLEISDVSTVDGRTSLRLGSSPVDLPEQLAALLRGLPRARRADAAAQAENRWLLPGSHAGQHLTATALGIRLGKIGVPPRRLRLAALDQLSREVPPTMLAGLLGLTTASAAKATLRSSGQWASYAAPSP